jgi:hypothetical protein
MGRRVGAAKASRAKKPASPLGSDMEDEVDKFHKQKERLSLRASEDEASEDSLDDEAVYDLSDEEEGESDDDGELYDTDEEIERETRYGKRRLADCTPAKEAHACNAI